MSRIVTVFGATGTQGGSIVQSITADGTFKPRAVTRDPSSESAQKLKALGAEIVQGDVTSDLESLKNVIRGSEAVFAVTQPDRGVKNQFNEFEQGKNLVDASKAEDVKFFIWSSLPHANKTSSGKYTKASIFDLKAEVDEYLVKSGLPYSIVYTGFFIENLWNHRMLSKDDSGNLQFSIPKWKNTETTMLFAWIQRELGAATLALLKNYNTADNKVVGNKFRIGTERMTFPAFTERISKSLEKPVKFIVLPTTGSEALDEMFEFQNEYGSYPGTSAPDPALVELGVKVGPLDDAFAELKSRGF